MPWLLETLPPPLRTALVHGSEGAGHLAGCARLATEAGLSPLAGELLLAAWAESPLDAALAGQVAALANASPQARSLAAQVVANSAPPAELTYYGRLAARRDTAKIKLYLSRQRVSEPGNLFWDRLSLTHALDAEDWDWAGEVSTGLPEPLARVLGGDLAMFRGDAEAALAEYSRARELWDCPGLEARLGLACLAQGNESPAAGWLRASLAREPWRTQALLALSDHLSGRRNMRRPLEGRVEVLLYTFNKAPDIDRTLTSLFASDLNGAGVTVLDNGGTDDTPAVLAAWSDRVGPERLRTVRLPVNVGAPAARNWLMSLPYVRQSDWTVFLDDDVSLPVGWLGLLGAAASLYPRAGVWGARVRDHSRPAHIQSADVFLDLPAGPDTSPDTGPDTGPGQPGTRRFSLSTCHHQTLDRGQFAYARPAATVTGCCHLFRTATLASLGGFDLRYSPSQYDDLDHDIRLLLSGVTPAYQGHLAVDHFKSTGAKGGEGQAEYGTGFANQYKLHQKFDAESFRAAARTADEAAWKDALGKWRDIGNGPQGPFPD